MLAKSADAYRKLAARSSLKCCLLNPLCPAVTSRYRETRTSRKKPSETDEKMYLEEKMVSRGRLALSLGLFSFFGEGGSECL